MAALGVGSVGFLLNLITLLILLLDAQRELDLREALLGQLAAVGFAGVLVDDGGALGFLVGVFEVDGVQRLTVGSREKELVVSGHLLGEGLLERVLVYGLLQVIRVESVSRRFVREVNGVCFVKHRVIETEVLGTLEIICVAAHAQGRRHQVVVNCRPLGRLIRK